MLNKQLRFRDLKEQGVANNWVTLNKRIDQEGFPAGRLLGKNTRVWDELEVVAWLDSRPTARLPSRVRAARSTEAA